MSNDQQLEQVKISPERITEILQCAHIIEHSRVISVNQKQIAHGKAWLSSIIKITLEYDFRENTAPTSFILKLLSNDRGSRDSDYELGAYQREINFYQQIAAGLSIRLPKLYCSESRRTSNFMLMEDLSFLTPGDQIVGMTYEQVLATVESLAKVHACYWNSPALDSYDWLPASNKIDIDYCDKWDSFVELCGGFIDPGALQIGEKLATHIPRLLEEISKSPKTIVHDDMKADNLLFGEPGTDEAVVILDWQFVIKSIGAIDVARLIGGSWFPADRKGRQFDALEHWYKNLINNGVENYNWEDAERDFNLGSLYNLFFPVHFHKGITRAEGRALDYIKTLYSGLFLLALEIHADDFLAL